MLHDSQPLIRVVILDPVPAFRYGLASLLQAQADIAVIGTASNQGELSLLLRRVDPDVLVINDQFSLGLRLKLRARARIVVCVEVPSARHSVAARLAAVDAVIDRAADPAAFTTLIRSVAHGERVLPPLSPRGQREAASRLEPEDRPVFAMLLAGTTADDIASVSGVPPWAIEGRLAAVIDAVS